MKALLRDLIGFHFAAKRMLFKIFFCVGEASGKKLNFFQLVKWALFV